MVQTVNSKETQQKDRRLNDTWKLFAGCSVICVAPFAVCWWRLQTLGPFSRVGSLLSHFAVIGPRCCIFTSGGQSYLMYFYFGLQGWRSYKLNILDTISVFFWAKMKLDWLHKNGYRLFQIPALKISPNQDSEGNNTNKEEFVAMFVCIFDHLYHPGPSSVCLSGVTESNSSRVIDVNSCAKL